MSAIQPRLDRTLDDQIEEAHAIIDAAVERWSPEVVYAAFSGGNDSTVMLDIVHRHGALDGVLHVNTTIGIAATRIFVRELCANWGLHLDIARPRKSYNEIVAERGFFGPKDHPYAYRLLKKDAVRQWKKTVLEPRKSTVAMLLTGMRAGESKTRIAHGSNDRLEERIAWVNPIRHFTNDDMILYRERHPDLPYNPVNRALGKSGECLCGCFSMGSVELEVIRDLDPATATQIERLQDRLEEQGSPYCRWGPGGQAGTTPAGPMCVGCDQLAIPA